MKRALVITRHLHKHMEPVVTRVVLMPLYIVPDSEYEARFIRCQLGLVQTWFCAQFPEFIKADWATQIADVSDLHWMLADSEGRPQEPSDALKLALEFHNAYEAMAPEFGYQTRPETRAFDLGSPNGRLMIAVCERLLERGIITKQELTSVPAETPAVELRD